MVGLELFGDVGREFDEDLDLRSGEEPSRRSLLRDVKATRGVRTGNRMKPPRENMGIGTYLSAPVVAKRERLPVPGLAVPLPLPTANSPTWAPAIVANSW